ncbi:magnesium/cobalt transporter CorA [Tenacibaculum sp. IB213877]|uniref:magnesium/cobalt transporter CorA n=1 Tax=Tenacibaculum sp. IB213877 TaxID=3097351 RepID=UPI002A598E45|nr:magnesium/cobalt transporter CorA [Tenacibaculum sp. IB213877]MDY0779576.1 magnesium/cobalt transporter CorA [Tenacibaculum sp. IB213877]
MQTLKKPRFFIKQSNTAGQVPGKLIFVGEQKQEKVFIELIAYNEKDYVETSLTSIEEAFQYKEKFKNVWINIDGLHDTKLINNIGALFSIHTLLLEDIVHTGQIPRVDIEENYIFTVIKMLSLSKHTHELNAEQISMFLTKDFLLTFQEKDGDVFEPVRDRIRNNKGRVRKFGLTYLKYSLLDNIVDNYNFLMEIFGANVEELEDKILLQPNKRILKEINRNKIELNFFRKAIRPAKEAILSFKHFKTDLINKEEQLFFNDLNDSSQRAHDSVESYKNMLSEQLIVYSTNVNNRLNDIMKILTIFSAVFIPITFIAGIYGTNFEYIPELKAKNGYFIMWGFIIAIALTMLGYFKYKKWF